MTHDRHKTERSPAHSLTLREISSLRNMRLLLSLTILSLLSAVAVAPVPCDNLLGPLALTSFDKIIGKWICLAGTADHPSNLDILKNADSFWIEFLPTSRNDTAIFTQGNKL
ncbi:hypothetical protein AAFF_G00180990 [Aldrovandia affinis]|uniref:Uncharacterized protein n=1 Tax=Aldrovandia affinis TaxID=143900 RepID=A0AAD7SYD6_9TELE|nr:hypothetical protein AAFF_G00180990 [Aldrovandia affinis]